jgi:hypothetical protein
MPARNLIASLLLAASATTAAAQFGSGQVLTQTQVHLSANFTPDPYRTEVQAGGPINAAMFGGNCTGYIASEPEFYLTYDAAGLQRLNISVDTTVDTTLVVQDPRGQRLCDDDSAGNLNPRVGINNPISGTYLIWVGTYRPLGPNENQNQGIPLIISDR